MPMDFGYLQVLVPGDRLGTWRWSGTLWVPEDETYPLEDDYRRIRWILGHMEMDCSHLEMYCSYLEIDSSHLAMASSNLGMASSNQ